MGTKPNTNYFHDLFNLLKLRIEYPRHQNSQQSRPYQGSNRKQFKIKF